MSINHKSDRNERGLPADLGKVVRSSDHDGQEWLGLQLGDARSDSLGVAAPGNVSEVEVEALRERFVQTLKISQLGATTVAFTPQLGLSPLDIIVGGQRTLPEVQLINPELLQVLMKDPKFSESCKTPEPIVIDGSVEFTEDLNKADQIKLLEVDGKQIAKTEDFAQAFVAFFVLTGKPFIGEGEDFEIQGTPFVRTDSGLFRYVHGQGLYQAVDNSSVPSPVVRAAGRVIP